MTWLKLGEEFPIELAKLKLSDAAFRTHVEGLSYSLDRETDGVLADTEVRRFAETADYATAVQELVDHGLWTRTDDGFRIIHHMEHQPTAAYLEDQRSNAARRKQREREKKALLAAGHTDDEAEAVLERRGLGTKSSKKSTSHRDKDRDGTRDNTRDADVTGRVTRNGAERSGTDAFNTSSPNLSVDSKIEDPSDPWAVPVDDTTSMVNEQWGLTCPDAPAASEACSVHGDRLKIATCSECRTVRDAIKARQGAGV